ncbi:MAG TPA: metal ABC transporter ATP-binding protein [Thermoplasmatales archaeon]|nr:metal ABC transporter ATP-binding protein [Candidatus Thermoplasmatota archaeon]HDS59856.1 metal ABC transporter ATP-binding protein [Thermoplasmatales archaeon]
MTTADTTEIRARRPHVPAVRAEGLTVKREGETAIANASFTIDQGEYVGIVGPNGGGKTTLLLSLLGLLPRSEGSIHLFGEPIDSFHQWNRIAYVAQDALSFDQHFPLTVRELVALGRLGPHTLGRRLRAPDWKSVDDALAVMDLTSLAYRRIGHLSGGQKQRVFVAKALVRNPSLLLLDEPVTGVDAHTQEKFYRKLSDLNVRRGITVAVVSHDLAAVFCRMSSVMCVNREVHMAAITEDLEPNDILKKVYGEHFHFVFHRHQCQGVFGRD